MRLSALALCASASLACLAPVAAYAQSADTLSRVITVDLPAAPLDQSIRDFSRAANLPVIAKPETLAGRRGNAVHGVMPVAEAMKRLLAGTNLEFRLEGGSILVTAPSHEADAGLEAVVVTGSRLQSRAEISARRDSVSIVDTLSRDDIGALPDITMAEALRRITGVTTIYNDDIGQFVSIRGTHPDFIPVTLNGLMLATTGDLGEGTRRVNLQLIPSDAVRQLQVFKSMTPDLDAGALGGLVNIETISAFETRPYAFSLTAGGSYSSYMDVPDTNSAGDKKSSPFGPSVTAMWAPRFGADRQFGLALTAFYEVRPRTQSNNAITNRLYYTSAGAATTPEASNWNGYAAPDSFVSHNYTNRFTKYGSTAKLEYKPSDRFSTGLFGFAYFSNEQETRNSNIVQQLSAPQNQTATTGTMKVGSADVQWRYNTFVRNTRGLQWKTEADVGERGKLSADLGYSYAWFQSERPYAAFSYKPTTRLSYDLGNDDRRFVLDNVAAYTNPANFSVSALYHDFRDAKENMYEGRLDYTYNTETTDRGFGFMAGGDYRSFDLSRDNYGTWYKNGTASMNGVSFIPDFNLPGYSTPGLWLDQTNFWSKVVPTVPVDTAKTDTNSRLNDYSYKERTASGYFDAVYSRDKLRADAGVRLDHTEFTAYMAQIVDGALQAQQTRKDGSYTNLQPYFTGLYSVTPSFRIKAAASRTLGRPNPETIATVETIDDTELTIDRGNPDIKPRKSLNLDLGFEYYFNRNRGMFTLTGFYKNIKDDILDLSSQELIDGATYQVTQPINGNTTKYKGVEVGFVNSSFGDVAGFLAPVGVQANAVWIDGKSSFLYNGAMRALKHLEYQSDFATNAAIFYSFGIGSELRLAMNHQGRYLETFDASPWKDIYIKPFTTVDLTASWQLRPNTQVRLEGRNILGANRGRLTGPNGEYHRAGLEVGSSWFARINFRL